MMQQDFTRRFSVKVKDLNPLLGDNFGNEVGLLNNEASAELMNALLHGGDTII